MLFTARPLAEEYFEILFPARLLAEEFLEIPSTARPLSEECSVHLIQARLKPLSVPSFQALAVTSWTAALDVFDDIEENSHSRRKA